MNIPQLEDRLQRNQRSPLFARLASCYLAEGDAEKGASLCMKGLEFYPDYATAHLILGKCYEAMDRNVEAILEYRRALRGIPDSQVVQSLLQDAEKSEQSAFQAFAEERVRKLRERGVSRSAEPMEADEDEDEPEQTEADRGKIVTVTLAEIYASQEEYLEAIKVYRRLLAEGEGDKRQMKDRMKELERLARARAAETKA